MKKNFTTLQLLLIASGFLNGQTSTGSELFFIDVIIDNQVTTFQRGQCGFEASDSWGGSIDSNFCRPIVWGYTANGDSLGCDSLAADYSGKIVLLRRGTCELGYKALKAQMAGADAVAIANGYNLTYGNHCTVVLMGSDVPVPIYIPSLSFSRHMTEFIDNAIQAGKNPLICFRLMTVHHATAEYAYATPVAQADTMDLIACSLFNRTGIGQSFTARAVITDPAGTNTELITAKFIGALGDSLIRFPDYVPPKMNGKFKVIYTVDGLTGIGDTLFREFELTKYSFATDNFNINGGEIVQDELSPNPHSNASLFKTGDAVFNAGWAAFGVHNPLLMGSEPPVNQVFIQLYDADADQDGKNDIDLHPDPMTNPLDGMPLVAFADFTLDEILQPDSILYIPLTPLNGDSVFLKPNHYYYLTLQHDDANTGLLLSFTTTKKVEYSISDGVGPVTPLFFEGLIPNSWPDRTVINRLVDAAFNPDGTSVVKTTPLDRSKFQLSPNPAGSATTIQLDLAAQNKSVEVLLIGMKGEIVSKQTFKNFRDGQVRLVTSHLPSGNYGVLIRTSEEGSGMVNLVVGH